MRYLPTAQLQDALDGLEFVDCMQQAHLSFLEVRPECGRSSFAKWAPVMSQPSPS